MAFYNRREFLQASAASAYLFRTLKLDATPLAPAKVIDKGQVVRAEGRNYAWEWQPVTDSFRLLATPTLPCGIVSACLTAGAW